MLAHYKTRYFTYNQLFMVTILFMKFNYYEFTTSVNKGFYVNSNSTNVLRFRGFEPRNLVKTNADMDIMAMPRLTTLMPLTSRRSRGFQFHADDEDVSIDLEFIVPFVRIPIERSMGMTRTAFRNLFNLNVHSILTTGAVVAIGGIFAILLKFLFAPFAAVGGYRKTSRKSEEYAPYTYDDNSTAPINHVNAISYVESKLHERNIDLSKCVQKTICEYVQNGATAADATPGTAGSVRKIVDGVLSLHTVRSVLSGTAVQDAVDAAHNGNDCKLKYRDCNWNPSAHKVMTVLTKVMKYLNIT